MEKHDRAFGRFRFRRQDMIGAAFDLAGGFSVAAILGKGSRCTGNREKDPEDKRFHGAVSVLFQKLAHGPDLVFGTRSHIALIWDTALAVTKTCGRVVALDREIGREAPRPRGVSRAQRLGGVWHADGTASLTPERTDGPPSGCAQCIGAARPSPSGV